MPKSSAVSLTRYFDDPFLGQEEVSYNHQLGVRKRRDPDMPRQSKKWTPDMPGYDEAKVKKVQEMRKARKKANAKKRQEMGNEIRKCHEAAYTAFVKSNGFDHPNFCQSVIYFANALDHLKELRRNRLAELKARYPSDKKAVSAKLTEMTAPSWSESDFAEFNRNIQHVKHFFDSGPKQFTDHFKIDQPPPMNYMSTAIAYYSVIKHQVMKATLFKMHVKSATGNLADFIKNSARANRLLHKMKMGWHKGFVSLKRPDSGEYNAFRRKIMTRQFREWEAAHPGKTAPKWVARFDPDYQR